MIFKHLCVASKWTLSVMSHAMDLVSDVTCNKRLFDIRMKLVSQYSSVTGWWHTVNAETCV